MLLSAEKALPVDDTGAQNNHLMFVEMVRRMGKQECISQKKIVTRQSWLHMACLTIWFRENVNVRLIGSLSSSYKVPALER